MTREPDLFGPDAGRPASDLLSAGVGAPLAARMRPRSIDDFLGQPALVGEGAALRELIERDRVPSLILWGPPGCGKTTLAGIVARRTGARFEPFSAVTEGIGRVRELIDQAAERKRATGQDTILFVDEIHRFNKAQQDAFLPHVEAGTITLIGATTENPSFEVVGPLLSRTRVFVLQPLSSDTVAELSVRALADRERGLGGRGLQIEEQALGRLAQSADGDARRALNALDTAAHLVPDGGTIDLAHVEAALQRRFARYDKSGEEHYNLISALHKSVRGSDADGALYWLARMLEGGEDPMYIARRLVRMAVEDIGLADPGALQVAVTARDAFHFLNAARETPAEAVPLHIRNAPTRLMKDLGYGADYRYDPDWDGGVAPQTYLPQSLAGSCFYEPGEAGEELDLGRRLERARAARAAAGSTSVADAEASDD